MRFIAPILPPFFLTDPRVAQRVASVSEFQAQVLLDPEEAEVRRQRLGQTLRFFLSSRRPFDTNALLSFISVLNTPEARALVADHGRVYRIHVTSGERFDAMVGRWGQVPGCRISFYRKSVNGTNEIFIRDLPPSELTSDEGWLKALGEIMERISGAFHEVEHARHFSGADAIRLGLFDRRPRLVSETLSLLEEHRQRVSILDFGFNLAAEESGLPLVFFLKNLAYQDNYGWRSFESLRRYFLGPA